MNTNLTGAVWRTSTRSNSNGGQCVEVADVPGLVAVRDSKDPDGSVLIFETCAWMDFVNLVRVPR